MTLTTRLAIAMIALVAVAVSAVGWLSYRSLEQALLPRVLDTIKLAADGIYVSPIHLLEENGVVETPAVAIMQIAMPVLAADGKPYGIVIVDADMRPALDRLRTAVRPGEQSYLVDGKGDYLV